MLIVRTSRRHASCTVGGVFFNFNFHVSLDIKIAKCTILKTGSDLTALFASAPHQLSICRSTVSVLAMQRLQASLWNSNFCFQ